MFVEAAMHINHRGFIYRTAYPFRYKPWRVTPCELIWRVPVMIFVLPVLSLMIWASTVLVFGAVCWITLGVLRLLVGDKFVYRFELFGDSPVIGGKFLDRLLFPNYECIPVESFPRIAGRRIVPLHLIVVSALGWMIWNAGLLEILSGALSLWEGLLTTVAVAVDDAVTHHLWSPVLVGTGFVLVIFLTVPTIRLMAGKILKSEAVGLLRAYLKAKKEKICPIIEVV